MIKSVKRTTEKLIGVRFIVSRPFHGLIESSPLAPTDESVGYCHPSASPTFAAKASLGWGPRLWRDRQTRAHALLPVTLRWFEFLKSRHHVGECLAAELSHFQIKQGRHDCQQGEYENVEQLRELTSDSDSPTVRMGCRRIETEQPSDNPTHNCRYQELNQ